jgi:hypothetical protein
MRQPVFKTRRQTSMVQRQLGRFTRSMAASSVAVGIVVGLLHSKSGSFNDIRPVIRIARIASVASRLLHLGGSLVYVSQQLIFGCFTYQKFNNITNPQTIVR